MPQFRYRNIFLHLNTTINLRFSPSASMIPSSAIFDSHGSFGALFTRTGFNEIRMLWSRSPIIERRSRSSSQNEIRAVFRELFPRLPWAPTWHEIPPRMNHVGRDICTMLSPKSLIPPNYKSRCSSVGRYLPLTFSLLLASTRPSLSSPSRWRRQCCWR